MHLFAFAPLDHDADRLGTSRKPHALVVAHHAAGKHRAKANYSVKKRLPGSVRTWQTPTNKKVPATDARTLLPTSAGASTSPTAANSPSMVVQNPSAGGQAGGQNPSVGPPIILIPDDASGNPGLTQGAAPQGASHPKKWRWVGSLYFDAGAEDLIGSFTDVVVRGGIRYYDDELDLYARNETLDTVGTGLAFQQIISGFSVGADYRHFFMKDHVFVMISDGRYFSGPFKDSWDFRVGAVGEWGWQGPKMFTDIYTDLFYVDLLDDTIYTGRLRSGPILLHNKTSEIMAYGVAQAIADSQGTEGSENRIEGGFGVGYIFMGHIALNIDLRAGYAFRGLIENRAYLNPMIILSGSF